VEILSPSSVRTDELRKRQRYEVFGVAELWIVDPESEVVRVYRREGEGFGRPLQLSAERGERLESALLPALSLPLPGLFAPGPSGRRSPGFSPRCDGGLAAIAAGPFHPARRGFTNHLGSRREPAGPPRLQHPAAFGVSTP
jgi:hypothetical protein